MKVDIRLVPAIGVIAFALTHGGMLLIHMYLWWRMPELLAAAFMIAVPVVVIWIVCPD